MVKRNVTLYTRMERISAGPLSAAIRQVAGSLGGTAENLVSADQVEVDVAVTDDPQTALEILTDTIGTTVMLISRGREDGYDGLAERSGGRLLVVNILTIVAQLASMIAKKQTAPIVKRLKLPENPSEPIGCILLVDDSIIHREAGIVQLREAGYKVIALGTYTEAIEHVKLMIDDDITIALIDLLMPADETMLSHAGMREFLGKEIGVGFAVMCKLAMFSGITHIAMATDTNHHSHPMSALVDYFGHSSPEQRLVINDTHCTVMHAPMTTTPGDTVKDWIRLLELAQNA